MSPGKHQDQGQGLAGGRRPHQQCGNALAGLAGKPQPLGREIVPGSLPDDLGLKVAPLRADAEAAAVAAGQLAAAPQPAVPVLSVAACHGLSAAIALSP